MSRVGKPIFARPWIVWVLLLASVLIAAVTYKLTGGWDKPTESQLSPERLRRYFID